MKHGELVARLQALDTEIDRLKTEQSQLIAQSRKLGSLSGALVLARQVKGVRSYLRWRQRYYQRLFIELDAEFCAPHVEACLQSDFAADFKKIESRRLEVNYTLLTALYQKDRLNDLLAGRKRWKEIVHNGKSGPTGATSKKQKRNRNRNQQSIRSGGQG